MDSNPSLTSDAWKIAVENHLASLNQSQKAAFKVPASPEECMSLIAKSQRRRGFTRIMEAMKPVLEPLKRFESVIDVVVQTNGALGPPIWGPLRLAIMIASDHLETLEKLALTLKRIVASLGRYGNYEALFKNNLNTQRAIGALYCDLIDLCARIVRFHSRPSIGAIFVSFDKEFQQVSENIVHHSTEIDWAANAANIEEAKRARGLEEATRQGQSRASVQQWLSPANVQDDLYRHESDCMSGSCNWVFETLELQAFLASESQHILRIGGAPGTGKSTLASMIIRRLMETITGDVIYFFCKGTDEKRQEPFQVLRTLISQLLAKDDSLYPWFETLYQQSGHKTARSFASLQNSFQLALRNTLKPLIYIVVDALDECYQGPLLASSLIAASKMSKGIVKLLLTSREDPELLDSFNQQLTELIISPHHVYHPVWLYVEQRVSQCKQISGTEFGSRVHTKVSTAAEGSWLYARLMMDEIQRLPSVMSIERQLQNIPDGLAQLYEQIFTTMEKSLSPMELRLSQQVFLWVDMSDFVEVGRTYLDREILDLVFQAENSGEEVFDSVALARQLCSPLIGLYEAQDPMFQDEILDVAFVHHTAAQFVRSSSKHGASRIPRILKPQAMKELYRGNTSVWYFEKSQKSTSFLQHIRAKPDTDEYKEYLEMAYGLWDTFLLSRLPEFLDGDQLAQAERLCGTMTRFLQTEACLKWIEIAIIINYTWDSIILSRLVREALGAAEEGLKSSLPFFQLYSVARKQFFADFAYVIYLTGPWDRSGAALAMPDGFEARTMATQILSLGKHWQPYRPAHQHMLLMLALGLNPR